MEKKKNKLLRRIPKSEIIAETYNDTINNCIFITTETLPPNVRFKLYLKTDNGYEFLKSKQNPYFKETHPW